jgi:hypothetical protein
MVRTGEEEGKIGKAADIRVHLAVREKRREGAGGRLGCGDRSA